MGSRAGEQWQVSRETVDMVRVPRASRRVRVAATPQAVELDLAATAIVVVDMQNDFCHPDGWLASIGVDVSGATAPVAPLRRLLPRLRRADVPVVWLNWGNRPDRLNLSPALLHVYDLDGASVGLGGRLPRGSLRGERVLEKGSRSAAIVDGLRPARGDIQVDKVRMSGFWDSPLDSILRNLGIRTLMFAGVNADQCVLATLMDANFLGYDTLLLEDCTATTSPEYCLQATLYNVRTCFGFVIDSQALLAGMAR